MYLNLPITKVASSSNDLECAVIISPSSRITHFQCTYTPDALLVSNNCSRFEFSFAITLEPAVGVPGRSAKAADAGL